MEPSSVLYVYVYVERMPFSCDAPQVAAHPPTSPLGHPGAPTKSKTAEAQGLDGSTTARDISKGALSPASSDDHHDPDPTTKKGRIRPRPSHPRSQNRLRNTGLTWCAMTGSRGLMFIAASLIHCSLEVVC